MAAVDSEIGLRRLLVPQHRARRGATQPRHTWSVSLWRFVYRYQGAAPSDPLRQKSYLGQFR
jgi:hypothetical protein